MKYTYEFFIWIDGKNIGTTKWNITASNLLRRALSHRHIEENIDEKAFGNLREELWHLGFELHEITRTPYFKKEIVS